MAPYFGKRGFTLTTGKIGQMNSEDLKAWIISKEGQNFFLGLSSLIKLCGQNSINKGFWREGPKRNKAEMIALEHSELTERLEAIRSPFRGLQNSEHCEHITAEEEECADLFIRLADYCHGWNVRLGFAIAEKMLYNLSRPTKHGKAF